MDRSLVVAHFCDRMSYAGESSLVRKVDMSTSKPEKDKAITDIRSSYHNYGRNKLPFYM